MTTFLISTFAKQFNTSHFAAVTQMLVAQNLQLLNVKQLNGTAENTDSVQSNYAHTCYQFLVQSSESNFETVRTACLSVALSQDIDVTVQEKNAFSHKQKLVCFDMDSTLIKQEVIVELAKAAGIGDEVAEITERAMRGEIDFNESFTQRVALLKGLSEEVLASIANDLIVNDGVEILVKHLKENGYRTAIISGGFTYFANYLKDKLGLDEVHANTLDIKDGVVTGNVVLPIVDGAKKAEILQNISKVQKIDLQEVVAVGDGANDLKMMAVAGLGVAFRAKPLVRENAKQSISNLGLEGVLHLLGITFVAQ